MQGFIRRNVPLWSRRALTMLPALAVLALGLPTTSVLVASQVALSFGVAFALVPLIRSPDAATSWVRWSTGPSPRRAPSSSAGSSSL